MPTPDKAPPLPKPKPKPKPSPPPVTHTTTPAPVYTPPAQTTPAYTPPATHPAVVHHKAKKKVVHRKRIHHHHAKPKPAVTTVTGPVTQTHLPIVLPAVTTNAASLAPTSSGATSSFVRAGIAALLALAAGLFLVGATPARAVRWRGAAAFVQTRQLDVTLVGVVLFAAAGLVMLLTRGH
ncbi:MAG TPA: hypothetical protein VEH52_12665 [Gaiellaceae bacterium]|nr:hypothetical protein [Gaiellaceae bacterium]